jgi:hypothetical protein
MKMKAYGQISVLNITPGQPGNTRAYQFPKASWIPTRSLLSCAP